MPQRYDERKQKFFLNVMGGMKLTDAAVDAGYTYRTARSTGINVMNALRERMAFDLEDAGITGPEMIERYLKPALEAKQKQYFQFHGVVTDERDVVNWPARIAALEMVWKLKGSYARRHDEDEEDTSHEVNVTIINVGNVQINE